VKRLFAALLCAALPVVARAEEAPPPAPAGTSAEVPAPAPEPPASPPVASAPPLFAVAPPPAADDLPPRPTPSLVMTPVQGLTLAPLVEIFAHYQHRTTYAADGANDWFHEFSLQRAFLGLDARWNGAEARVILEAVRSANDGGTVGVAGNALVTNVREAFAGYTYRLGDDAKYGAVEGRLGIVPTLVIPTIEQAWRLRVLEKSTLERAALAYPADVGAVLRYEAPKHIGDVAVALENGEGYQRPELNRGKNLEVALRARPLAFHPRLVPLTLLVAYQNGSLSTGSARADRVTTGLLWIGERVTGGAAFTYGWGVEGDGAKPSFLLDAFARVEPLKNVLVGARVSTWVRDVRVSGDVVTQVLGTVGYRLFSPLELYAAVARTLPASVARAALPGEDALDFRIAARVAFGL
jgi:hypothetical protein